MTATAVREVTLDTIFSNTNATVKEKLVEAEAFIKNEEVVHDFGLGSEWANRAWGQRNKLVSHLFIKEITPFGFHMQAIVYNLIKIDTEEDAEEDEYKHVLNRVYELEYNLRDKHACLKKNGKELKFSESNIRNMFSGQENETVIEKLDECAETHMYSDVFTTLGAVGYEQTNQVARFLDRFMNVHVVELIYKSGVPRAFAKDFIRTIGTLVSQSNQFNLRHRWLNLEETSPVKVLGVPKAIFKLICQEVLTFGDITGFQNELYSVTQSTLMHLPEAQWRAREGWVRPEETPEEIATRERHNEKQKKRNKQGIARAYSALHGLYNYACELDAEYGLDHAKTVIINESESLFRREISPQTVNDLQRSDATCIAFSLGLDLTRVVRYLYYQLHVEQGYQRAWYSSTYRDYLRMMKQLNLRVVNYPKALKTSHDIATMNMEVVKDEKLAQEFAKRAETYKFWEDTKVHGSKYIMVTPDSVDDLAKEGSSLHHCVFSYARQVANGETNILFMRHKDDPETSLVTVEIRYDVLADRYKVIQARGHSNRNLFEEEEVFLQKWCAKAGNVDRD